ncbi:hypothetical protein Nepgr_020127 [Nepenthes gracilis]|uniref:Leucine-rich repeat-containing N-terminal plant-type domain-containing protein n=1 Tax=Nepenthes gracilis TaxID=150966 RepID=A0AAD3XW22_NEPGR|nr:hypothetical protein Nepgr_020127 [Nepenthes gracilis]
MMNISSVSSHIFAFFFLTLFVSMNLQPASSQCLKSQMSLLLQLRSSLGFNRSESTKLVSWNNRTDCCQWKGVSCDGATGFVIGLDLSGESISEMDNSSSLFELRFLESLNLANNLFSNVTIPSGIGRVSGSLTRLDLSNAGFSGQVPLELSKLRKLVVLDLSNPYYYAYYDYEYPTLRFENPSFRLIIRNLTNIRELYLDGVNISARGHEWCEAVSSSLPNLQVLSLSNCYLSGEIDRSLSKLESLSVIRLDQNNLSAAVPEFMAGFRNLTSLVLSSCGLIGVFPEKIFTVPTLETLDLGDNSLLQGTLPEFAVNGSLQTLILADTSFTGNLPDSISRLTRLRSVDLSNCNFGGEIPSSIARLDQLLYLDFSSNNFVGPIPPFSMATNLTQLILYGNNLSSFTDHAYWKNLSKLAILDISNNSLGGRIPESLFSIPWLEQLQLSQNLLSGRLDEFLKISSPVLYTIDLRNNNLEGPIPKSFFRLQGLGNLKLSSNNFNGSLDLTVIRQLKSLTTLDLSNNNLSIEANGDNENISSFPQLYTLSLSSCNLRSLPNFLKNQSKLTDLDLSDNQIDGKIPVWIWNIGTGSLWTLNLSCNYFQELERPVANTSSPPTLDIHSNRLQGQLPNFPPGVGYLDLSHNNFTSIIPTIGVSLTYVYSLSLSGNHISGRIPRSLCNASNLQFLDLSHNQMDSEIPDCLKSQSELTYLDLSDNQIDGKIPAWIWNIGNGLPLSLNLSCNYFQELERPVANTSSLSILDIHSNRLQGQLPIFPAGVQYLDLSHNNFTSIIPTIGVSLTAVVYLSLSGNHISGRIPKLLCNASNLQVLDLSDNQMDGEIPDCLTENLVVWNLRGNRLNGSIPDTFTENCTLRTIDFNGNFIVGKIPRSVANCSNLEVLDIGNNQMNGTFPTDRLHAKGLEQVNLAEASNYRRCCPTISTELKRGCSKWHQDGRDKVDYYLQYKADYNLWSTIFNYSTIYYQDVVTVTFKGLEFNMQKILTVFTSIDFSNNGFTGEIPESLGNFKGLIVLNLSHNSLSGSIPQSIGNISELESLDLSFNELSGSIPEELVNLNFLSILNLSFNKLVGEIPRGGQFNTFQQSSFEGNEGLCGFFLNKQCGIQNGTTISQVAIQKADLHSLAGPDWQFILAGIGFVAGNGIVVWLLMFWSKGSKWFDKQMDRFFGIVLSSFRILCWF